MPQMMPLPWLMVFFFIFLCFYSVFLYINFYSLSFYCLHKSVVLGKTFFSW